MSKLQEMAAKIEAAGMDAKVWNESRVYVTHNGKPLGYLVESDASGSTGTCKNITARSGAVAAALRAN